MVIFGTLGLAVPYIPRPPGENDPMKSVFLGGASGTWGLRHQFGYVGSRDSGLVEL
jgi:hypothetical protein